LAGIHITGSRNRIEGNHVTHHSTGYLIDDSATNATSNLVIRNSGIGNDTGFAIHQANGNKGVVSADPSSAAPWANFAFQ
jgi:hypothetical protein